MEHTPALGNALAFALRDYGRNELAKAIEVLDQRGNRVHAGVHQARKAIRRSRAMLALGDAVLGPGAALISGRLKCVNRRLSPLRDAHALVETLDRLGTKVRDKQTRAMLAGARSVARKRRAAASRQPEFIEAMQQAQAVLATLRAALDGLPWDALTAPTVTDAMTLAARRAEVARKRAFGSDEAEDWHRWRRRMRRISQQHRATNGVGLEAPVALFDKSLTEQLGVLQDLSLLIARCGRDSPFPKATRVALRRFADRTLARQRKRIRSVAKDRE